MQAMRAQLGGAVAWWAAAGTMSEVPERGVVGGAEVGEGCGWWWGVGGWGADGVVRGEEGVGEVGRGEGLAVEGGGWVVEEFAGGGRCWCWGGGGRRWW